MEGAEVMVPEFTSGDDVVLRKGQRLGHAAEAHIPCCEKIEDEDCREECGAVESEQTLLTGTQRLIMRDEIPVSASVAQVQRRGLACHSNEYRNCFAKNLSELEFTEVISMDAQKIPGSTPVTVRPYRTNAVEPEAMRDIAGEWEKAGIGTEMFSS
ncbi:hypothetical protein MTO96_044523 [Rhipicephalus appendiculatus]